jgi:hypothetical protein
MGFAVTKINPGILSRYESSNRIRPIDYIESLAVRESENIRVGDTPKHFQFGLSSLDSLFGFDRVGYDMREREVRRHGSATAFLAIRRRDIFGLVFSNWHGNREHFYNNMRGSRSSVVSAPKYQISVSKTDRFSCSRADVHYGSLGISKGFLHRTPLQSSKNRIADHSYQSNGFNPDARIAEKFPVLVGPYARPTSIFKKYAYFIAGVFCVILGWLLIRAILPGQDTFIGALIVIALGIFFLFCGQRLIFKSLASAPANSDYRPVANVSSLSAPCGLAPPSARLGAAS